MAYNDSIDEIFTQPSGNINKGTKVYLNVTLDGDFVEFESNVFNMQVILTSWHFYNNGKKIAPFKLIDYKVTSSNSFSATLMFIRKQSEGNEIKLLCKDLMDVLNFERIAISSLEIQTQT